MSIEFPKKQQKKQQKNKQTNNKQTNKIITTFWCSLLNCHEMNFVSVLFTSSKLNNEFDEIVLILHLENYQIGIDKLPKEYLTI